MPASPAFDGGWPKSRHSLAHDNRENANTLVLRRGRTNTSLALTNDKLSLGAGLLPAVLVDVKGDLCALAAVADSASVKPALFVLTIHLDAVAVGDLRVEEESVVVVEDEGAVLGCVAL